MTVDFSMAVKHILESNADFYLQSSFFPTGRTTLINAKLNKIVAETPEMRNTVTAIVLYPALKWAVQGKADNGSYARGRMEQIQEMLVVATGERPHFTLEKRSRYYSAIQDLVRLTEDSIEHIGTYPESGKALQEVLEAILFGQSPEKGEISYYKVNKRFEEAVYVLDTISGDAFARLLSQMTDVCGVKKNHDIADFDYAYVHHNTNLLLRHYTRIVWSQEYVAGIPTDRPDATLKDKAVCLLDCESIEAMASVTDNHRFFQDAYSIAEFMKLISEAIDKVGLFPKLGPESKRVLEFVTDPARATFSSQELESEFHYGQTWFYHNKKIAVKLLSFCLWGCSPHELLDMVFS